MADKLNKTTTEIKLRYTCAAFPPIGIDSSTHYTFGKDEKGFYYASLDNKYYAELWFIKMLFTPVDKTWVEVEKLY